MPTYIKWVNGKACLKAMDANGYEVAISPREVMACGITLYSTTSITLEEFKTYYPKPTPSVKKVGVKKPSVKVVYSPKK